MVRNRKRRLNLKLRTDDKLDYAEIHLEEIVSRPQVGIADQFERAHEESVLFHVVGAKDAFLQETSAAYGLGLRKNQIKEKTLEQRLKSKGLRCSALTRLQKFQSRKNSWLADAIELRNQGMHRASISRMFDEGGPQRGRVFFRSPRKRTYLDKPIPEFLGDCISRIRRLLSRYRTMLP
jgi:hypothetical protein